MRTTKTTLFVVVVLSMGLAADHAYGQRGMGQTTGVARMDVRPDVESFSGKVQSVVTGPCEKTTGPAVLGTHFLLETPEGTELNVHLGPAAEVDAVADRLSAGRKVTVDAFRTENMPENHYVAQSFVLGETTIELRDENLRPFWAGGNRDADNRAGERVAPRGRGGPPSGRGWGRSSGRGRGPGYGRGYGRGRFFIDEDGDGICDNAPPPLRR